jgi:hypothetical protein
MRHKVMFWLVTMLIFLIVFSIAYVCERLGVGILNLMPKDVENMVVMGFSVLGMGKCLWEVWILR